MLLDPGMNLTLRPMRYPDFYERYRDAIRNTWTVEEVDLPDDLVDLQAAQPRRAAPDQPAGRVLRHRRLDRGQQPGAQPLQAHQRARGPAVPVPPAVRGGAARAVLPDPARHLPARRDRAGRGVRRGREHPVDQAPRPSSASGGSTRSSTSTSCETRERPAGVPAQPDLLRRRASRGCSSSAPSPTSTSCARRACSTGWPPAPTGCSATSRCTWTSPSTSSTPCARRSPTCSTTSWRRRSAQMMDEAVEAEAQFAEDLLGDGVAGLSTADMRAYLEYVADQRLARLGLPSRSTARRTRSAFMELQDVQELSQLLRAHGSRPTRSASPATSASTRTSRQGEQHE